MLDCGMHMGFNDDVIIDIAKKNLSIISILTNKNPNLNLTYNKEALS